MRTCLLLALLAACGSTAAAGGGGGGDDVSPDASGSGSNGGGGGGTNPFAATTANVVIEIDYETGQQPYTGNVIGFGDTFAVTQTNIDRLFAGKRNLTLPTTLSGMEDVGTIDDEQITVEDLAALADAHRQQHDTAGTKTYYVIFVSGHFEDSTGVLPQVLGVSVGDTVVMFKDTIESTGGTLDQNTARYVEQSTLTHELAHSIGLVDNGVPMVADHKDAPHGAHCNNPDCVEYWLNEGASDARDFALRRVLTGDTILFDDACLADVDALTGGP
jgi:hypothetical protein